MGFIYYKLKYEINIIIQYVELYVYIDIININVVYILDDIIKV